MVWWFENNICANQSHNELMCCDKYGGDDEDNSGDEGCGLPLKDWQQVSTEANDWKKRVWAAESDARASQQREKDE